jgi:hypothetical protein
LTFRGLSCELAAEVDALFAALQLASEGGGEVDGGDTSGDPLPGSLDGVLVQALATQPLFNFSKQEEVYRRQIRRIRRVLEPLDAMGIEPIGDHGGGVHGRVVPVEKPPLGQQLRPFQPQTLPELAQDINDVGHVDGGAPGGDVGVDEAARIEEPEHHLLAAAGLHLCLQRPWLALQGPVLAHSLCLRGEVRNQGLVQSNNVVQHGEPAALDGVNKFLADLHAFLFLHLGQQFGHPARRLLHQAQIFF